MSKTFLVTGGCGFIGSTTCDFLLRQGHEVIAYDNLMRKGVERNLELFLAGRPNFSFVEGDIRDFENIWDLDQKIDGIVHLAANPGIPKSIEDPLYDFDVNARGTLLLLQFARECGNIPFVFASTNKIYSERLNEIPFNETETRYEAQGQYESGIPETFPMDGVESPHSPYGCSKASADLYCQEYAYVYGVPTVTNRMSAIYGPWQRGLEEQGWLVWFMINKIKETELTIFGDGKQVRCCLFGEDLARLYEQELLHSKIFGGHVYNVGGGKHNTFSLNEFINYLDKTYPQYAKMSTRYTQMRLADQFWYVTDTTKIEKTGLWTPTTSLKDGIDKTFKWVEKYKEELG